MGKSFTVSDVINGTEYFVRCFPKNPLGIFQTRNNQGVGSVVPSANDPYTSLLLHFDGNLIDSSINKLAPTSNNASANAIAKFGSASGNYANLLTEYDYNATLDFGVGDWTIDFWINVNSFNAENGVISTYPISTAGNFAVYYTASKVQIFVRTTSEQARVIHNVALPIGTWVHLAFVRNGTTLMQFRNGILVATSIILSSEVYGMTSASKFRVGRSDWGFANAKIDELRVSKGIARWITNFTPPTQPYER